MVFLVSIEVFVYYWWKMDWFLVGKIVVLFIIVVGVEYIFICSLM